MGARGGIADRRARRAHTSGHPERRAPWRALARVRRVAPRGRARARLARAGPPARVVSRLRASPARAAAWPATPRAGWRAQLQNAFAYILHSGLCLCVQPRPHCVSATLAAAPGNLSTIAATV